MSGVTQVTSSPASLVPEANHFHPGERLDLGGSLNELFAAQALAIAGQHVTVSTSVKRVDVGGEAKVSCHTFLL
jgi:hypothetical protein